jgi:membrane-bound serine protease (ClpP class)
MRRFRGYSERLFWAIALGLALWGLVAWASVVWNLATHASADEPAGTAEPGSPPIVDVAQVTGVIDPINAQYLARVVQQAEADQATLLIVELDTPGGLLTSLETMTQTLLASKVPTAVYVTPTGARAGSAGVFIAMAADVVAMAPGTVIGAAHPISAGGAPVDPVVSEKVTNYAAAYARTLATTKGHNADWAEQAVRASAAITEQEALQQGVADLVARDRADLLRQLQGRRVMTATGERILPVLTAASMQRYPPNPAEIALKILADPNIAFLLFIVGVVGIIVEIYHPGAIVPGVVGAIALVLDFIALGNLPTNWGAAGLLGLSLILFLLELHLPSHGVLGIGGVIAFLLGGFLLFAPMTPVAPVYTTIEVSPWLLLAGGGLLAAFFLLALRIGLRARRLPVRDPLGHLNGARGIADSALAPAGTIVVGHEHWSAIAEGGAIAPGEAVEVMAREGLRLRVRRVSPSHPLAGLAEGTGTVGKNGHLPVEKGPLTT